jgi:cob(I)alamin adenosyltransferase
MTAAPASGNGTRAAKDSPRVVAMGEVDELNACIGVLAAEPLPEALGGMLARIQHDLFDLGGELCIPGHRMLDLAQIEWLETELDRLNESLPPLQEFILPGGSRQAALCHLARTVCRRAERSVVELARSETVETGSRQYLNRLSDFLFVLARILNRESGHADVLWRHDRNA